jgi:hypothetical protein
MNLDQLKMAPKITVKKDYILVEPKEVDYWQIWESIGKVRNLPEFPEKNDIWVFHDGPIKLTYVDLYKLKDFVKEIYPENVKRSKTAIVVESGLQSAIALFFAQIAKDLPFEIKVFFDFQTAENWITNK